MNLEIQALQDGITIRPGCPQAYTTTAKQDNGNNSNDDDGGVLLFGLFNGGGHLLVHEFSPLHE